MEARLQAEKQREEEDEEETQTNSQQGGVFRTCLGGGLVEVACTEVQGDVGGIYENCVYGQSQRTNQRGD